MNQKTESPPDDQARRAHEITASEARTVETVRQRQTHRHTLIVVAVLAIVAIAAIVLLLVWNRNKSGAGRPVPAPRTLAGDQSTTPTQPQTTDSTVTLSPQTAQNAGIKVEPVGEQLVATGTGAGALATGTVQANTYRSTPVVSLVGGIVRRVNAELGQSVRQGQTMAVVFSDDLAMAQSKYLTAVADLEEHHKHHTRTMKLVEIGAASREEVEQATTLLRTAEAEVASQRQRLLLLGLAPQRVNQLNSSSQVSSEVSLPAPVSGSVISRTANPGEVIQADKEILRIADLSSVWVIGQVYEKDLGSVRVGSGASITSEAYPGRVFRGRVSYVDPTLDTATRTGQVRIELANPGQTLKIGMYVNVAFGATGAAEKTAPTIPASAVQNLNGQQVVFVATNDPNVFVMRPVRVGLESNGRYQVLEGLNAGDRVVTEGSFLLRAEWVKTNPNQ
ncbi:MAG: efflux RND transporter periplasmic adaptor subunit [Pyrinomonadaceae bacterium]